MGKSGHKWERGGPQEAEGEAPGLSFLKIGHRKRSGFPLVSTHAQSNQARARRLSSFSGALSPTPPAAPP